MALKKQTELSNSNKTVLITGVSRGLGKRLFELCIAQGYNTYGVLRNEASALELASKLPDHAKVIIADLSSDACIVSIQKAMGQKPIDLLINNAGIGGQEKLLAKIESEEIMDLFNVHCLGVFRVAKALKENLLKAHHPIVLNLNSRLGSITRQSNGTYENISVSYSYRIAKAAQNMLTNCLRNEFKGEIKFISLHPGKMKTDIAQVDADVEPKEIAHKILSFYEQELFAEENGILEIGKELIEW